MEPKDTVLISFYHQYGTGVEIHTAAGAYKIGIMLSERLWKRLQTI
jgi:hypothetical protein